MVVGAVAVAQQLKKGSEKIRKDLEALTDDDIRTEITHAQSCKRRNTKTQLIAGAAVSLSTLVATLYVKELSYVAAIGSATLLAIGYVGLVYGMKHYWYSKTIDIGNRILTYRQDHLQRSP